MSECKQKPGPVQLEYILEDENEILSKKKKKGCLISDMTEFFVEKGRLTAPR